MAQGETRSINLSKLEVVIPYVDILFDLVDSVAGMNVDATASAIYNIVDTLIPVDHPEEHIDHFLALLRDELQQHIGG